MPAVSLRALWPALLFAALAIGAVVALRHSGDARPDEVAIDGAVDRLEAGLDCQPGDAEPRARHGRGEQPESLDDGLRRSTCAAAQEVPDIDDPGVEARPFAANLHPAGLDVFPALVDSNSPAYWRGDTLNLLNSAWAITYRSQGPGVINLQTPTAVQLPRPARPGHVWIEAVWQDTETGVLYGWYHFEPADIECLTAPIIGAAVSFDGGATWEDRGFVLENGYPHDCSFQNGYFTGGNGDFSVILGPSGRNLYFLFSNYQGSAGEQGIAVARSALSDRGQPGTVWKYYQGRWGEPGLGGRGTAVIPSASGWAESSLLDAFWGPSVHWNSYLNSYVALLNRAGGSFWAQEGVYITFSLNLVDWTLPQKILDTNELYPQVLGLGEFETDTLAGQWARVYVGGISEHVIEFSLEAPSGSREIPRLEAPAGLRAQARLEPAVALPEPLGDAPESDAVAEPAAEEAEPSGGGEESTVEPPPATPAAAPDEVPVTPAPSLTPTPVPAGD